jgi:signal transduction histidine kinase
VTEQARPPQPVQPGGSETRALRRASVRLGLQTGAAVALVVVALIGVALAVVLHTQHQAAVDLVQRTVVSADDVTDPPVGTWLVIRTPTKLLSSQGVPRGFPLTASLDAAADDLARTGGLRSAVHFTSPTVGGVEYMVATQARRGAVVQAVLDLSADHEDRDRLVGALLLSGIIGLLLAVLAGAVLASRAMSPFASALALQRRFVADASHELRTPLTLLSTRAQLIQRGLRRDRDPAALAREIDGLVGDADHLAMILEDLLVAADPRGDGSGEVVDLCVLADQVVAACEPTARSVAIELGTDLPVEPVHVHGAPVALRRALTALVDNAIRHATRAVLVTVGTRGGRAVVEVSDDGPGIADEILPRLFERYESAAPEAGGIDDGGSAGTTSDNGRRRYGLGLALVSEVAARHGGEVSAYNGSRSAGAGGATGPTGATLELTLPVAP